MKLDLATIYAWLICLATVWSSAASSADEIVISGNEHVITVGDFDFTPCNSEAIGSLAGLNAGLKGEVTAGELWQHFADRGFDSVENLTICMDWAPGDDVSSVAVSGLQLQIEDPLDVDRFITNVSLGSDSFVVPDYEISPLKPEARLGVSLGYDFMKRFSSESKAKIKLNFGKTSSIGIVNPTFSFDGSNSRGASTVDWIKVLCFIAFWVVVFKVLALATIPRAPQAAAHKAVSA